MRPVQQSPLPDDIRRLIPLTPAVFYVMLAVASGPKHGYAIMQETETLSEKGFRMGPATLYSTIQRLVELNLVTEIEGDPAEDSRRRYYELTRTGRQLLETEVQRMNAVLHRANARLVERELEN